MQHDLSYHRSRSHLMLTRSPPSSPQLPQSPAPGATPRVMRPPLQISKPRSMHIKQVTLTSKKNWWMVELDEEQDRKAAEETHAHDHPPRTPHDYHAHTPHVTHGHTFRSISRPPTRPPSPEPYNPPRHPNTIFSFPTPAIYSAQPNSTSSLRPFAQGSASELFKCIVKKPDIVQLEINGEMQSNATDVAAQFLAELRVYTAVPRHRNLAAFLGCLDGVGMVIEFVDGRTLYDVIKDCQLPDHMPLSRRRKRDFHNQLLAALTHVHAAGLSHGDLSLLNVQVADENTESPTLKLLDFGRSVAADSVYAPPDGEPVDPFAWMSAPPFAQPLPRRVEQIHPGTRPFSAPEVLRGECQDARLADAYSYGMVLVCLERCELVDVKPWEQRKDKLPADLFDGCELWVDRIREYLRRFDARRPLMMEDMVPVTDD
ncbi:kinase-like domain-containing protein [Amylostereum chailletii]|nr:kinase-like domain-containing protein [Amylostereum chailletii]